MGLGDNAGWFTVHRSSTVGTLTVNYAEPPDSATPGLDYAYPAMGSVTFLDGSDTAYIDIEVFDDAAVESTERVTVVLNPSMYGQYQFADRPTSAWIRIGDNDRPTGSASISGQVWDDSADHDGIREVGEAGIGGQTVWLYADPDYGTALATATTNSLGHYTFAGLAAGLYAVEVDGDLTIQNGKEPRNNNLPDYQILLWGWIS